MDNKRKENDRKFRDGLWRGECYERSGHVSSQLKRTEKNRRKKHPRNNREKEIILVRI